MTIVTITEENLTENLSLILQKIKKDGQISIEIKDNDILDIMEDREAYEEAISDYKKGENIIDGETAFKKLGI